MKNTFDNLIQEYNTVELTTAANNYPKNLSYAILSDNFKNWKEMKEFADDNDLQIINISTRDGWDFWVHKGGAHKPLTVSADYFGDNYEGFSQMSEQEFFEKEIEILSFSDFTGFEDLEKFISKKKELFSEIEQLDEDDDGIIIALDGCYYDTYEQNSLYFTHDTHHYSFGLIEK